MNNDEIPKKISSAQVEVLGADGEVVKPAREGFSPQKDEPRAFGQIQVMKLGPWALVFLPVLIPILILGFFLLLLLAMVFGKGMFKIIKGQIRPRG